MRACMCAHVFVPVCPCVCSWVSTHCQVVEAARTVKEEVESTSEDCSEELIQLEVGSCPHTHTHAYTHTHTQTHSHTHTDTHTYSMWQYNVIVPFLRKK